MPSKTKRDEGEFFTPDYWARTARLYLLTEGLLSDRDIYDPCAGQGALTRGMGRPAVLSTLLNEDLPVLAAQHKESLVFQLDFVNNPIPQALIERFETQKRWLFLLNPPYSAPSGGEYGVSYRDGISSTWEGQLMVEKKLDHAPLNLTTQFLHKIMRLTRDYGLDASVGLFSQPTFLTSGSYTGFRKEWLDMFGYVDGFVFHSQEFDGVRSEWPVLFSSWKLGSPPSPVRARIYEDRKATVRFKEFSPARDALNTWVKRPRNIVPSVPLKGAMKIYEQPRLSKLAAGALGYLAHNGNTPRHQNHLFILSGPYGHGDGWSITPDNYERSLVTCAARRLISRTWTNDRDEFSIPDTDHPDWPAFRSDAVAWCLFAHFNEAASMRVVYDETVFEIRNEFFFMSPEEFEVDENDPFAYTWLKGRSFSPDVTALIESGRRVVRESLPYRVETDPTHQLVRWDAGLWQLRTALYREESLLSRYPKLEFAWRSLQEEWTNVADRLRPLVYALGMLPKED